MSFLKYFMFPAARRRYERRERRHALRQAENAKSSVIAKQEQLISESKKYWNIAKDAMKNGEKAAAERALISYRSAQSLSIKLEQKRWVFEQYLTKMEVADSDKQFVSALGDMTKIMSIDPEKVEDVFDAANELLDTQLDADKFWQQTYTKETANAKSTLEEHIPSMEELSKELEHEVAADLGGEPQSANQAIDERISEGQARVKSLLDGK